MKIAISADPDDDPRRPNSRNRNNGNGKIARYASRGLPKEVIAVAEQEITVPPLDRDRIRAIAISCGRGGESGVRDMAGHAFDVATAELAEQCHLLADHLSAEIAGADRHITEISDRMRREPRHIETQGDVTPWTTAARIQIIFFIALSLLLLLVGINTNAVVLMSSGIAAFEHPLRAYFFSMIPIGIAGALKALGSLIEDHYRRRTYTIAVWTVGLVSGFVWARLFAATFPMLTQTAADIVRNLAEPTAGTATHPTNSLLVFVAMTAEACLAAGGWLTAQAIYDKHHKELADNPVYLKHQQELDFWSGQKSQYRRLEGRLAGKIRALDEAHRHYVEQAVADFRVALKWAANNDHLDEFLRD